MTDATAAAPLLSIRDLRIAVQKDGTWTDVLHGVSLDLARGEMIGIIGESGAGKSTIGLAALGHVRRGGRFAGGSVLFDGIEMIGAKPEVLEKLRGLRIAYVAQSAASAFNPAHRIGDQFAEVLATRGARGRAEIDVEAATLFAELGLPDPGGIGRRYPHQLSGGQLQRAMIAMAMATAPDLLIFDEPTTALDVTTQLDVLQCIRRAMKRVRAAALYITHDLALVAQLADHIMVMRHGSVVESGTAKAVIETPRQDYTRALLAGHAPVRHGAPEVGGQVRPLLKIDGLAAAYGATPVLQDISLRLHKGETVAIVGESGSGKSTLARVLCGLLPSSEGGIIFDEKELPAKLKDRSPEMLRRIQLVHQLPDLALNMEQTVEKIIGRPAALFRKLPKAETAARVRDLLRRLELPEAYAKRYPWQLSGGEKQRVAIARALAAGPDLLICDEVTSALDQLVATGVLDLLGRLKSEFGLGILLITHDIATVQAVADRVVVLRHGRIVEQGPAAEVMTAPREAYTRSLIEATPQMEIGWLDRVMGAPALG